MAAEDRATLRITALAHRSSQTRFLQRVYLALACLALCPLVLTGCRSNAQHDLVARELRMQEDQLYAMEDYLSQYQQLVCKYRSENAQLRRQLAEGYYDGDELPPPKDRVGTPGDRRAPSRAPTFRAPQTPQRTEPAPSETQIELPDVPPLEGSSATEADTEVATASHTESTSLTGEAASAADEEPASHPSPHPNEPPNLVALRGEVTANDSGGGPRLMVDVQRLDPSGNACGFEGNLSLLVLERGQDDVPQNLARWDFTEADAQAAWEPLAGEHVMRFYLELPAETLISGSTELWVRLLPPDGTKLLTHADVNLQRPGEFSSEAAEPPTSSSQTSQIMAATTSTAEISSDPLPTASNQDKGEWKTAGAGQLTELAVQPDTGQWRASTEPMPVVQSSFAAAVAPVSRPVQRATFSLTAAGMKSPRTYARPTWSPDRSTTNVGESPAPSDSAVSRRPVWSDKR
jgi:hypothetical protein